MPTKVVRRKKIKLKQREDLSHECTIEDLYETSYYGDCEPQNDKYSKWDRIAEEYFKNVTIEQLARDLLRAGIVITPKRKFVPPRWNAS